jgi:exodeoxyribonuclease V alpha subunit
MMPSIEQLYQNGYLSDLDFYFARTMGKLGQTDNPLALLAAAAVSRFTSMGHVCVNVHRIGGHIIQTAEGQAFGNFFWPNDREWLDVIRTSPLFSSADPDSLQTTTPLVVDSVDRLYLARYWRYQIRLAHQLCQRMSSHSLEIDTKAFENGIDRLFAGQNPFATEGQRQAVKMGVWNRFSVISGGPGTGKTTTILRILALLIEQACALNKHLPRIQMMAPTGKAAARLKETLNDRATLVCPERVIQAIPDDATTIHRALKPHPDNPGKFRYNADNLLDVDVVVVDEASMIDLSLMTHLVDAIPLHSRLIFLGDRDQLASVETGAILSDICSAAEKSERMRHHMIHLTHSFRFDSQSGIGRLSNAINAGDLNGAMSILDDSTFPDVAFIDWKKGVRLDPIIEDIISNQFLPCIQDQNAASRLDRFNRFRLLCAHRQGEFGAETLNARIDRQVKRRLGIDSGREWYIGRPVMIQKNDYLLNLYNGDIGIATEMEGGESGRITVCFQSMEGGIRSLAASRLPVYQPVFAMTVHKSQGSEFDHVLLLLPETRSPVITRELLYTAITRAKKKVVIAGSRSVIQQAISTPIERASGLMDYL